MPKKRLPRKERERLRQRREILAAALELFSEKGYYNVSMHEIAERSEFAIGTLYRFFKNKEDLYKALMMEKAREFHQVIMEALNRKDDVFAMIEGFIAIKGRLFRDNLPILRLYFAETRGASFNIKAGLDQDIRKLYDESMMRLASVLERGIKDKVFRDIDPYSMAVALEGLINAFLFSWLEDPEGQPYEANIMVIKDIFLKGVLAR